MKSIAVAEDIIPVAEFKAGIAKYLRKLRTEDRPKIITQNGKPAAVLLSPREYDDFVYYKELAESIQRGLNDVEQQQTMSTEELRSALIRSR